MPTHESSPAATRAPWTCLASATVLLLAPLAYPALAAAAPLPPADDAARVTVSYRDLDIARPIGASQLLRRIETAAHLVCGDFDGPRPLSQAARAHQCFSEAVARAVAAIHSEAVTARYLADFAQAAHPGAPRSAG